MGRIAVLSAILCAGIAGVMGCGPGTKDTMRAGADKPFFRHELLVGAHRGGADVVPENTVEGFREALDRWPGILLEADATLTSDGHVVLLHDKTVDRTTDGTGPITGMTLAEVKRLDAGYRLSLDGGNTFPYRGKGVTIATLEEALEAFPEAHFLVEFKDCPGIVDATVRVIQEARAEDRVLLASFVPEYMTRARELAPDMAMCYDFANGSEMLAALRGPNWDGYEPRADVLSLMVEMIPKFGLTPEEIQRIRAKGIRFQIHTPNTLEDIRHWLDIGVDSVLTDRPDLLLQAVAEREGKPRG